LSEYGSSKGDCCSRSWIEHIDGVNYLIGHEIMSVKVMYMPKPAKNHHNCVKEWDVVKYYSVKITTDEGICDIDFRNSSNGYYGGSFEPCSEQSITNMKQVTHDYMHGQQQSTDSGF